MIVMVQEDYSDTKWQGANEQSKPNILYNSVKPKSIITLQ